jgi:hypothetical protein
MRLRRPAAHPGAASQPVQQGLDLRGGIQGRHVADTLELDDLGMRQPAEHAFEQKRGKKVSFGSAQDQHRAADPLPVSPEGRVDRKPEAAEVLRDPGVVRQPP